MHFEESVNKQEEYGLVEIKKLKSTEWVQIFKVYIYLLTSDLFLERVMLSIYIFFFFLIFEIKRSNSKKNAIYFKVLLKSYLLTIRIQYNCF